MLIVQGDLRNIKGYIVQVLKELYDYIVPIGQISTNELNEKLIEITELLAREVAVYINRQGKIVQVSVGDSATVDLPALHFRSSRRLAGIRCIHTHPSGDTELSTPDLSSLRRLRFDVMVAIGRQGKDIMGSAAFFTGEQDEDGTPCLQGFGPVQAAMLNQIQLTMLITTINKKLARQDMNQTSEEAERALLAGIEYTGSRSAWTLEESLAELERLAETAGAEIMGKFTQRREKPDAALFLGKGKVEEIAMAVQDTDADLLLLDDEITPSQQHNLEQMLGIKVLDRTALILDIFAQRANSRAGKLQVELAQLKYNLPRIGGQGLVLSRLGGGIGTRGPGETKLEVDRRRIYTKINDIEKDIARLAVHRQLHRSRRQEARLPLVALIGYTNAGKSTLLNALTGSKVLVEDKLFATLDPTTRRLLLPNGQEILLTDTVGFIQKLPHTLVSAFHATLEEAAQADLLLHVVDCSNENYELQIAAVIEVLKELHADEKPMLYVFNKSDCLMNSHAGMRMQRGRSGIFVSARQGDQLDALRQKIAELLAGEQLALTLCIPFADGAVVTQLHQIATIRQTSYNGQGTILDVLLPPAEAEPFLKYKINESKES